jgi:hypothetical protein
MSDNLGRVNRATSLAAPTEIRSRSVQGQPLSLRQSNRHLAGATLKLPESTAPDRNRSITLARHVGGAPVTRSRRRQAWPASLDAFPNRRQAPGSVRVLPMVDNTSTTSTSTTSTSITSTSTTSTSTHSASSTSMVTPGANAMAGPGSAAVGKRLPALYHAILDADLKAVTRQLLAGDRIFASIELVSRGGVHPSRQFGTNLFEFALDHGKIDCALIMLRQCTGRDAIERDARLLDLFHCALEQKAWNLARILLKFFTVLRLRLRPKSYHLALRCMLDAGQIRLASMALNLNPACPLTFRQVSVMAHHALKSDDHNVVDLLLRAYPEVLKTSACSVWNVLRHANGQALAALLKHGLQLPALNMQQLGQLLERLLADKEQHAARELLIQHKAAAPPYASLLGAAIRHQCEFFLKRLVQDKDSLGGDDQALVAALHGAVRRKSLDAAQLLTQLGVKFFGEPAAGVDLLERLVSSGRTRALVMLIESGQLSREMVFSSLIRHRKVQTLTILQRHFQLSFCEQVNSIVRTARLAPCSGFLSELQRQMRFASHARDQPRARMMCAMAQAGLGYSSASNLVTLRERLMRTELGGRDHFEEQFLLAMAAYFSIMDIDEQQVWPLAQFDVPNQTLRAEGNALNLLGRWVVAHAASKLQAELEAVLARFSYLGLRRSLQTAIGLPASLAHLVEAGCQDAIKDATSAAEENRAPLTLALSRAIHRLLEKNPAPKLDFNDLVSVWESVACQILLSAVARMTRQAAQQ